MNIPSSATREALMRELEHMIDEKCESIINKSNKIINNTNVNAENFTTMTFVFEALEEIDCTVSTVIETLIASSLISTLNLSQKKISIVDE